MDLMARRRAIMGMPSGKDYTVSGNVVSVSNALAKPAKSLVVSFSPKQSGSGDPSPSNVRPITGYNDIGAVRYGKNMWSMTACVGCSYNPAQGTVFDTTPATLQPTDNGDGSFSVAMSSWERVCFIVPVPNGASVRSSFSRSGAGGRRTIGWLDADKKVIGSNYNNTSASENYSSTWTASGEAKYLFFVFTSNTASTQTITYPQVELGNTATQYEPYISPVTANVHSDTTLFGGTVDLVSGECIVDRVFETITGNSNWYSFSTGTGNSSAVVQLNHWDNVKYTSGNASYNGAIGSSGREAQNYWTNARQNEVPNEGDMAFAYSSGGQLRVHRTDVANITDLASFKSAFEDLQICYPLATPITYQLTPSQLAMLKGNNTVYSNEGSISLTYVGK